MTETQKKLRSSVFHRRGESDIVTNKSAAQLIYNDFLLLAEKIDSMGGCPADVLTGTGVANYVSKFTAPHILGNSQIYDNGTNVGIGITTPEFKFSLNGGIMAKGNFGSGITLAPVGVGARMFWYPKKAAFRVGYVNVGNFWDDVNIGIYSFATGRNTIASGEHSIAMGYETTASGWHATAMGIGSIASGDNSVTIGCNTRAIGNSSTAMGDGTTASGDFSTAMGYNTTASGDFSTAMGYNTTAQSYCSMVFGTYNIVSGDPLTWIDTDPLFVIGNGIDEFSPNNALTVLKNGKVGIGTTTPEFKLSLDNDGGIMAKGTYGSGATLTTTGAGARMFWYPKKSAFRAGYVNGTQWDDINIGEYSAVIGGEGNTVLSQSSAVVGGGDNSVLSLGSRIVIIGGSNNVAANGHFNYNSVVLGGYGNYLRGINANFIVGGSNNIVTAVDKSGIVGGEYNSVSGYYSAVISGSWNSVSGSRAVVLGGWHNQVSGAYSAIVGGEYNSVSGHYSSVVSGTSNTALASSSIASGNFTTASSFCSFVFGAYNITGAYNPTTWVDTDPLFVIGNGVDNVNRNNALTILKNGNIGIGTSTPQAKLDVFGDGDIMLIPRKTTTGDPTGYNGASYYNSGSNKFRVYEGGAWKDMISSGSGLPSGTSGQTLRHDGTNWIANSTLFNNGTNVGIGTTTFDSTNPEKLKVDAGVTASVNVISGYGTINNYLQSNIKNLSNGISASSDLVATADNGTELLNYIDCGINSSTYNNPAYNIGGVNDGYLYVQGNTVSGGNLCIGTATADRVIRFHIGGTTLLQKRVEFDGRSNSNPTIKIYDTAGTWVSSFHSDGILNTFLGLNSGYSNSYTGGGTANTFIGARAGYTNSSGANNTFFGAYAGYLNASAGSNTFIGGYAGYNNTGGANTFIGVSAGYTNVGGANNTFIGANAGYNNTGANNTFIGLNAGYNNTNGASNTTIGYRALYLSSTAVNCSYNVAIGQYAMGNVASYSINNTVVGFEAMYAVTSVTLINNCIFGYQAGKRLTSNNNTAFGYQALGYTTFSVTGANNTAFGYLAGDNISTGSNNILIGYDIDAQLPTGSNQLSIGNLIFATGGFGTGTTIGTGNVGIGTPTPHSSAILDLTSTNKGFLPPRMTGAQASAITAVQGLLVFITTINETFTVIGWWGYNGTVWIQL